MGLCVVGGQLCRGLVQYMDASRFAYATRYSKDVDQLHQWNLLISKSIPKGCIPAMTACILMSTWA